MLNEAGALPTELRVTTRSIGVAGGTSEDRTRSLPVDSRTLWPIELWSHGAVRRRTTDRRARAGESRVSLHARPPRRPTTDHGYCRYCCCFPEPSLVNQRVRAGGAHAKRPTWPLAQVGRVLAPGAGVTRALPRARPRPASCTDLVLPLLRVASHRVAPAERRDVDDDSHRMPAERAPSCGAHLAPAHAARTTRGDAGVTHAGGGLQGSGGHGTGCR